MASIQSTDEMRTLIGQLEGKAISVLQVLGINSLKSMAPMPSALVGETITTTDVRQRAVVFGTASYQVVFDLQRVGKLVLIENATPYTPASAGSRPTVRLLLADGVGMDIREPSKTKRVTATITEV